MQKITSVLVLTLFSAISITSMNSMAAIVITKGGQTYIEDQTGERWNVTQAKSIGFEPGKFQYGIGKNTFTTLDDSYLKDEFKSELQNPKVIGVKKGDRAHAYSISKLRNHEIANTKIGGEPIAVGY
jgi:hypothetical protein